MTWAVKNGDCGERRGGILRTGPRKEEFQACVVPYCGKGREGGCRRSQGEEGPHQRSGSRGKMKKDRRACKARAAHTQLRRGKTTGGRRPRGCCDSRWRKQGRNSNRQTKRGGRRLRIQAKNWTGPGMEKKKKRNLSQSLWKGGGLGRLRGRADEHATQDVHFTTTEDESDRFRMNFDPSEKRAANMKERLHI